MKCERCGLIKPDVEEVYEPYLLEIEFEAKLVLMCDDCFDARKDDI